LFDFVCFVLYFLCHKHMTNIYSDNLPDPRVVLRAAEEEPPQRLLDDYTDAIHALREKNFTFREIAEWLGRFGFAVDHNAVYRAYAKTVPEHEAIQEAQRDDEVERDEAVRAAGGNGSVQSTAANSNTAGGEPQGLAEKAKTAKRSKSKAKRK
jgi:hypothetical protein